MNLRVLFLTSALFLLHLSASAATWIVDSRAAADGNGSADQPFRTLRHAEEASAAGDVIVIARGSGPYRESIALKDSQTLSVSDETAPAPTIAGIHVRNAGGVTVRDVVIDLAVDASGVLLEEAGKVTFDGGGVKGSSGTAAVRIEGGDAAIAFDRFSIALASGTAVAVKNRRGGSLTFGEGSTIAVNGGGRPAVVLTAGAGKYAFREITAAGTQALHVADSAVELTLGSLSVDGTVGAVEHGAVIEGVTGMVTIGGGTIRGVQKRGISISRSNAITIRNMNFANVPAVNGTAANACGNPTAAGEHLACGAAIHLQDAGAVTLEKIRIDDSAQSAIVGDTVRDLTMSGVAIRGAGDETHEHGVQLRNVSGALRLIECSIEASEARQLHILNDTGDAKVEIRKSTFRGGPPPNGQQAILLQSSGDARLHLSVDGSEFAEHFSNAVHIIAAGSSDAGAEITGNTFRGAAAAVAAMVSDAAKLTYRIDSNTIANTTSTALNVHATTSSGVSGSIVENVIGVSGKAASGAVCGGGCSGISVTALGRGTSTAIISDNTIQQVDANGIVARAGADATLRTRITANVIRQPAGADVMYAIAVSAGMRNADRSHVCAEIGGAGDRANTISGSWNAAGGGEGIALSRRGDATSLTIAGYAGDRTSAANVSKFVAGRNRGSAVQASVGSGVTIVECPLP